MLRMMAVLFGIGFIFAGVAGFLPNPFLVDGLLLGHFAVNSLLNLVHIATGVLAIMAATGRRSTVLFFRIFGLAYIALAITGLWKREVLMMNVNTADSVFHLLVGVLAIYLGFLKRLRS